MNAAHLCMAKLQKTDENECFNKTCSPICILIPKQFLSSVLSQLALKQWSNFPRQMAYILLPNGLSKIDWEGSKIIIIKKTLLTGESYCPFSDSKIINNYNQHIWTQCLVPMEEEGYGMGQGLIILQTLASTGISSARCLFVLLRMHIQTFKLTKTKCLGVVFFLERKCTTDYLLEWEIHVSKIVTHSAS